MGKLKQCLAVMSYTQNQSSSIVTVKAKTDLFNPQTKYFGNWTCEIAFQFYFCHINAE